LCILLGKALLMLQSHPPLFIYIDNLRIFIEQRAISNKKITRFRNWRLVMASKMQTLDDLYTDMLKDLYSAEKQLVKALPKMAKNAQSPDLQKAFQEHLKQTEGHVERIERIFSDLGGSPRGKKCVGMEGLVEEGNELLQEQVDPDVLDAGLIAAAQKVEHYEIASYGTVRTWAEHLGYNQAAQLLQQTLDEEGEANKKLTQLAESHINMEAQ
jgi:ferritin-like metal-binding protein YciE